MSEHNKRTGDVWISDFDRGVVTTLGGVVNSTENLYVIKDINGVEGPPDMDDVSFDGGVPVYFAFSDERLNPKVLPSFIVRRDDITPAMSRWHLGSTQYRVPADHSDPVTITNPLSGNVVAEGYDAYESKSQAVPYDLMYTIQIRARYRNNLKVASLQMLRHVMTRYQPYTSVYVEDSKGDTRAYTAFTEGPKGLSDMSDVADRENGFNVTLRVEAELDLNDPFVSRSFHDPKFQSEESDLGPSVKIKKG